MIDKGRGQILTAAPGSPRARCCLLSIASISRVCCANMAWCACALMPPTMGTPGIPPIDELAPICGAPGCTGWPGWPTCPTWVGFGYIFGTFCPIFSPRTYVAGSFTCRRGYCRTGCPAKLGMIAGRKVWFYKWYKRRERPTYRFVARGNNEPTVAADNHPLLI